MLARAAGADKPGVETGRATIHGPVTRLRNIDACIEQPSLQDHVLAVHLGGPKRVTRLRGRHKEVFDVAEGAITLMPAQMSFRWRTEGPVDFAHVALGNDLLGRIALENSGLDPTRIGLQDRTGVIDVLLAALVRSLISESQRPAPSLIYVDSLLCALTCHVLRHYSDRAIADEAAPMLSPPRAPRGGLAGWQRRRVLDHMTAHLAEDVRLAEIVALTGLSRSQFFHAFGRSLGCSPHAYLTTLRVERARALLRGTDLPIGELASMVGLSQPQLGAAFRRRTGVSPRTYRRECGVRPHPPFEDVTPSDLAANCDGEETGEKRVDV